MLKITNIEEEEQLRVVVEGKLIAPWTTELKNACEQARTQLKGRKLVVEMQRLTVISQEGEDILLDLMNDGVEVCGSGLFTREILKQLARKRS
ncbi:hypothetical protein JAO29_06350 [Edaphobacter sp. HDX4]|uniref:hypothetical protein n=1 Tax=Edaphobacter sp. HDX4 TaxID=2794064 RepID=UPI002FE5D195